MKRNDQVVIFDFDGTIADTFRVSIGIFERMTKRNDIFTEEEIEHLRGLSGLQVVRELRIKPWLVPFMLIRGRAMMRRNLKTIAIFEGIKPLIVDLHKRGVPLYITSSNSTTNILKFLKSHDMDRYFVRIYGNVGLFGKARALRQVLKTNRLQAEQVTYIGDETRDIEAAKHVGIRSVAVTWGFNSAALLEQHNPDALAKDSTQLAKILRPTRS